MAKIGLGALLNLAAILSISVGMLNLLPIPLLDGGHLPMRWRRFAAGDER
jgi:regulator of sigma E protease